MKRLLFRYRISRFLRCAQTFMRDSADENLVALTTASVRWAASSRLLRKMPKPETMNLVSETEIEIRRERFLSLLGNDARVDEVGAFADLIALDLGALVALAELGVKDRDELWVSWYVWRSDARVNFGLLATLSSLILE